MQKVKMLRDISGGVGGHYNVKAGDVIAVPDGVADDLCDRPAGHKLAERVKVKTRQAKREIATSGPDETAVEK